MTIDNALASLAVSDLEVASRFYARLLGPGNVAMPEVMEWQFERGGGLQVYTAPERAGQGSCTLVVNDIDELARHLRATGIAEDAEPVRNEVVDTVMIKDPDGNSIAFSNQKSPGLAR